VGLLQARDGNSEEYGHELRDRVWRTDLGFAAPFLLCGVIGLSAGALELALASAVCFTGRVSGDPPGYQTAYMVRRLSRCSDLQFVLPQLGDSSFDFSALHFRYHFITNFEWILHELRI
jgi:hypothetical protein